MPPRDRKGHRSIASEQATEKAIHPSDLDVHGGRSVLATRVFDDDEVKDAHRLAREEARQRRKARRRSAEVEAPSERRRAGRERRPITREPTDPMGELGDGEESWEPKVKRPEGGRRPRGDGRRGEGERRRRSREEDPSAGRRRRERKGGREVDRRRSDEVDRRRSEEVDRRRSEEVDRRRSEEVARGRGKEGEPRRGKEPERERSSRGRSASRRKGAAEGRLTLLFSCHGGSGSTTLATTSAAFLAQAGRQVCILDLDLQFGDVLTSLNMVQDYCLAEAVAESKRLDLAAVNDRLPRHHSGLRVLSQSGRIEGLAEITVRRLVAFIDQLRDSYDHVLVDGVRDFNDFALAVLDLADDVVLVATQDVPTIRGLAMRLDVFEQLGYDPQELVVVVNRHGRRSPISLRSMRDSLDVDPSFVVANDFKRVHRAMNEGMPLSDLCPDARVTQDIARMVSQLFDVGIPPGKGAIGRLFAR